MMIQLGENDPRYLVVNAPPDIITCVEIEMRKYGKLLLLPFGEVIAVYDYDILQSTWIRRT